MTQRASSLYTTPAVAPSPRVLAVNTPGINFESFQITPEMLANIQAGIPQPGLAPMPMPAPMPVQPMPQPMPMPQPVPIQGPPPVVISDPAPVPMPQPMPRPVPPKPPVPAPYDDSGNPPRGPRNPREPVPVPIPQPIPEPVPVPPAPPPTQIGDPPDFTAPPAPPPTQIGDPPDSTIIGSFLGENGEKYVQTTDPYGMPVIGLAPENPSQSPAQEIIGENGEKYVQTTDPLGRPVFALVPENPSQSPAQESARGILDQAVGNAPVDLANDFNGDGRVTSADALAQLKADTTATAADNAPRPTLPPAPPPTQIGDPPAPPDDAPIRIFPGGSQKFAEEVYGIKRDYRPVPPPPSGAVPSVTPTVDPSLYSDPELGTGPRPTLPPAPQPVQVSPTYDTSTPAPLPPQPSEGLNIPGIGSISPEILAQIQAGIGGESGDFKGIGSFVPTEPPVQGPPTVDPSLYSDPELGTGPRPTGGRRGEGEPSGIETMAESVGMGDYMEPSISLPDGTNFDLSTLDFSNMGGGFNIGGGFNLGNFSPNLGLGDTEANGSGMPNVGTPNFTTEDDPSLYSDPEMSVGGPRGGPQGGPGIGNGPGFTMGGTDASGNGNGPGFGDNAGGGSGPGTPDPSNPYPFIPDSLDISGMDDTMLNGLNGFYEQFPNGIMPGGFSGLGNIDFSNINVPGGTNDGSYTVDPVEVVGDLPGGPGGGVPPNDGVDNGEDPPDVPPPPPSVYTPPNVRSASTFGLVGAQPTLQGANPFARPETQAGIGSLAGGG